MKLMAGFECGKLPWNGHDLLVTTNHLPETNMTIHYERAIEEGAVAARDGLVPGHDLTARLNAAADIPVIWDMIHYHWPDDPRGHAEAVGAALNASGRKDDRLLAVNEPSCTVVHGRGMHDALHLGLEMMRVASDVADMSFVTCDPLHSLDERNYEATDALVSTGKISLVGVNYYPHHAADDLSAILKHTHDRYGLPVFVAETGWHDGHPLGTARFPHIQGRLEWLDHVKREIEHSGVEVEATCWYPWLSVPPWDDPHSEERWPSGWPGF